jgi:hypothetical protein
MISKNQDSFFNDIKEYNLEQRLTSCGYSKKGGIEATSYKLTNGPNDKVQNRMNIAKGKVEALKWMLS